MICTSEYVAWSAFCTVLVADAEKVGCVIESHSCFRRFAIYVGHKLPRILQLAVKYWTSHHGSGSAALLSCTGQKRHILYVFHVLSSFWIYIWWADVACECFFFFFFLHVWSLRILRDPWLTWLLSKSFCQTWFIHKRWFKKVPALSYRRDKQLE